MGALIFTVEIEEILSSYPAVAEVAVVGIPSEKWGEELRAYVVLRPLCRIDDKDLLGYCEGRPARYKSPKSSLRFRYCFLLHSQCHF